MVSRFIAPVLVALVACRPAREVAPSATVYPQVEAPDEAMLARRKHLEMLRAQFESSTAFRQFVLAERMVCECVAIELDAQGRWEPDDRFRVLFNPPHGTRMAMNVNGRAYTFTRGEFPEFDAYNDLRWRFGRGMPGDRGEDIGPELASQILTRCDRVLSTLR